MGAGAKVDSLSTGALPAPAPASAGNPSPAAPAPAPLASADAHSSSAPIPIEAQSGGGGGGGSRGLSGGAIAGIVIGVLAALALAGAQLGVCCSLNPVRDLRCLHSLPLFRMRNREVVTFHTVCWQTLTDT